MHRRTALALCGSVFGTGCLGALGDRTPADRADDESPLPATADDATSPRADEWPTFGADAGNRSTNPATTGPADRPGIEWTTNTDLGTVFASPVVADGLVIQSDSGESPAVVAFDANTGTERWRFTPEGGARSAPAVHDGTVYVGDMAARFYALDAEDGTEQWRLDATPHPLATAPPTVVDGTVFVPGRGAFLALDADDGTESWRHEFGEFSTNVVGAPAVADDRAYVVVGDGTVVAFDAATGDTEWTHTPAQDVSTAPVAVGGSLFVAGQGESALIAFDAATGDVRWRRDLAGQEVHASPVVAGGTVVATSTSPGGCFLVGNDDCTSSGARGGLAAFDVETGERRWRFALERGESAVGGTPVSDGQRVFVPLGTGLAAVELETGERRWRRELDTEFTRSAPALAGGRLVVSGNDGRILSLGG